MEVKTVTDLSSEPVTLAVAKAHLKSTYSTDADEDALINSMIKSARQVCEKYCNRSLGAKTLQVFWHNGEIIGDRLIIPYGPHKAISTFVKVNQQGTETALVANTDYYKRGNEFFEIDLNVSSGANPWAVGGVLDYDFKMTVTAGYGTSGLESLPEIYKEAILKTVAEWYVFRENYTSIISSTVRKILDRVTGNTWL